jgi:hypothetical protein
MAEPRWNDKRIPDTLNTRVEATDNSGTQCSNLGNNGTPERTRLRQAIEPSPPKATLVDEFQS